MTIDEAEPGELGVDVILDDDLQPEGGVVEGRDQQQHQQDRRQRAGDPVLHGLEIGADQPDHRADEPQGQRHQRDRGDPLSPPVLDAFLGRAQPDGPAERRAHPRRHHLRRPSARSRRPTLPRSARAVTPRTTHPPR